MKKNIIIITIFYIIIIIPIFINKNDELEYVNYQTELPEAIVIELTGEVNYPGTYTFYEPVYLEVLIKQAGGFTENAELISVNQFELLSKTKRITIPAKKTEGNVDIIQTQTDLNKASFSELIKIPSITEQRAANIIVYRTQNGRFNSVDELLNVSGIGLVTYEKISKYFTV